MRPPTGRRAPPRRPVPTRPPARPLLPGAWGVSRGGSMLAVRCALLAALLAAPGTALIPGACPALDVPSDLLTSLPGANVTLTCPGVEPGDNVTIHWVLRNWAVGSHLRRWASVGRTLHLRSVQLSYSGNYSCYRDGHPAGTVRLLVEAPPGKPQISCFQKSPVSSVQCEWSPHSSPSPTTKAVLLVWNFSEKSKIRDFQVPCQYSQECRKFSCQLRVPEGDSSLYAVSLCVTNSVGRNSSRTQTFKGLNILRPDPPVNITVSAMVRNPRRLSVTWQSPPSWNSIYYRLQFELRYRAERSKTFTMGKVKDDHHYVIYDALSGMKHVVQVRAQEEFGHGLWSEWSQEATGIPWTVQNTSSVQLTTFLVAGGSLAFGTLLCIGVVLRFKESWKQRALKEGKTNMHPPYTLGHLVPERPKSTPVLVPLISPSVSPSSLGSDSSSGHSRAGAQDPQSSYDISNRDYFFPR
ncbi:interleukin-6 receptor subunit alpha [Rhynchocyon petersi]